MHSFSGLTRILLFIIVFGLSLTCRAEFKKVPLNFQPAMAESLGEFIPANKDEEKMAKKLKKTYGASKIEIQKWKDGHTYKILYPKERFSSNVYQVLSENGLMFTPYPLITQVDIVYIDSKPFILGSSSISKNKSLYNSEGKRFLGHFDSVELLSNGEDYVWVTKYDGKLWYHTFDGEFLFASSDLENEIESTPAVAEGVKTINFGNGSVDIYSPAYPKYYYCPSDNSSSLATIVDGNGERPGFIDLESEVFYPAVGSGYIMTCYEPNLQFEMEKRYTELGGKIIEVNELITNAEDQPVSLKEANTNEILHYVHNIVYCSDNHSITYSTDTYDRASQGAIFLRDTLLNIPPKFVEAGFVFNEATSKWEPWVRRKLYSKSEPYTPGLENEEIVYANEGEKIVNEGRYRNAFSKYYDKLPDDYLWTKDDLNLVNYAGFSYAVQQLQRYHYDPFIFKSPDKWEKSDFEKSIKHIEEQEYNYVAKSAIFKFNKAIESSDSPETAEYAAKLKANMENFMKTFDEYAQVIKDECEHYLAAIVKAEKEQADFEEELRLYQAQLKADAEAKAAARRQNNSNVNAAIMYGIGNMIGNTIGRALGGGNQQGFNVIYTEGASNSYSGGVAPTVDSSASTSSGAKVETSKKCTACNGSGQCNACHGHPGYATAGDKTHKCASCHGSVRCPYCNGTGFKNL